MKVLDQGKFTCIADITQLNIIDFQRCNGSWGNNPALAMEAIANHLVETSKYTVIELDLTQYPEREDWPGWNHVGNHEHLGRLYWNMFKTKFGEGSTLTFSDMPDFEGTLRLKNGKEVNIYGDVGMVSASTFALEVLPRLKAGDLWVSVLSKKLHITIEPLINIGEILRNNMSKLLGLDKITERINLEEISKLTED